MSTGTTATEVQRNDTSITTLLDAPTGKHIIEVITLILLLLNSLTYPNKWDNPVISSIYLHEASSGWCDKFLYVPWTMEKETVSRVTPKNKISPGRITVQTSTIGTEIASMESTIAAITQLTVSAISSAATQTPQHTIHPLETSTVPENDTSTASIVLFVSQGNSNVDSFRCTSR